MTSSDAHQRSPTEIAQVAAGTAELEKEQARKAMARAKEAYKAETKVKTSQTTAKKPVATKTTTTTPKAKDARALCTFKKVWVVVATQSRYPGVSVFFTIFVHCLLARGRVTKEMT